MLTLSCGMTASTLFTSHSDCSTCISPPLLLLPPQQSEFIIGASLMLCGHQPHHPAHAPTHHPTLSSTSNPSGSRSACFPDAAWFGAIRMGFAMSLTKLRLDPCAGRRRTRSPRGKLCISPVRTDPPPFFHSDVVTIFLCSVPPLASLVLMEHGGAANKNDTFGSSRVSRVSRSSHSIEPLSLSAKIAMGPPTL